MSYAKQTHVAGQKLTAAQLNHMENGIVAAHNAYNLLDNSDFRNPINQRGTTSTKINAEHIIDRWRVDSMASQATVSINANGITLEPTADSYCSIYQQLERYAEMKGKIYTIAICVNDIWDCKTVTIGQHAVAEIFNNGIEFYSIDNVHVLLRNREGKNPITIQRVALYEGTYTADTLPAYQPKGYAAELAECQRYYQQYSVVGLTCRNNGYATTLLPVTMRVAPTISVGARRLYTTSYEDASGAYPNTLSANTTSIFFSNYFYEGFVTITCNDVTLSADL